MSMNSRVPSRQEILRAREIRIAVEREANRRQEQNDRLDKLAICSLCRKPAQNDGEGYTVCCNETFAF